MSQYLKTPDSFWIPEHLYSFLAAYVCPDFVKFIERPAPEKFINDGGEALIQKALDNSNHKLRMYGPAQELIENLRTFRNHPEASRMVKTTTTPFYASAVIYHSLKNEPYILKSDLFVILQNMAVQSLPELLQLTDNSKLSMAITLRHQLRAVRSLEFVKFDQKFFDEIEKELREGFKKAEDFDSRYFVMDLVTKDYDSIIAKLTSLNSVIWPDDTKRKLVQELLPKFEHDALRHILFTSSLFISSICANCIENVIHQRPEVFKSTSALPTVRVFEDEDQRFVLCQEIQNFLTKDPTTSGARDDVMFCTWSMQEIKEMFDENQQNVEFIRTPILRSKHRAVPIVISNGQLGTLAADVLFEFLRQLIFGEKAFQVQTLEFLQRFKAYFDPEIKGFYFLHSNVAMALTRVVKDSLRIHGEIPTKDVRNAKKDGFTVQNLKNELAYLNLTKAFPEIQNNAEIVYTEVDKRKKENVLRTCDLFDAIEHCQLICIFNRLPNYKKFLHNQKGCHRVYGYKCEKCEEEMKEKQKTLELQKVDELAKIKEKEQKTMEIQNSSRIENLEKELAQMKLHLEKMLHENRKLQSENQKLSVENVKKALPSTKPLNTQLLNKKYSNPDTVLACTSNRIQCLICEIHVDSSNKDDIIRCPLCKRRFHKKCAFEWLQEHSQCPACNGNLPKI